MDMASVYYLGVTIFLFLLFAVIVARTYSKKHRVKGEEPKYRMMDDQYPTDQTAKEDTMSDDNKEYDGIRYREEKKSPAVFRILFTVLVIWGVCFMGYYLFSGWSSHAEYAGIKKAKEARLAAQKQKESETKAVSTHEEIRTTNLMDEGKKEYASRCASCHGADGKGGIGPDLTLKKYKYGKTAPEVTTSIVEGRPGGMPGFKNDLSGDKIQGLVQYVLSL